MTKRLTKKEVEELFAILESLNPEPKGELNFTNLYTLLIAVLLSAQATDIGVNKATAKLFTIADSPEKMLRLGLEGLKEHIKTIGLYNSKAQNVIKLSEILLEKYNGQVPEDRDALESLPGVGRKTANVVLNIGFGHPTIAVDTHIFRVSNRTGLALGKTPLAVEEELIKVVPAKYLLHAHHWLILHGRYICKAKKPLCANCPINHICKFPDKNI